MRKFFWVVTALSAAFAWFILIVGVAGAPGVAEEAAVAAVAIGIAVIPYCFSRAVDELDRSRPQSPSAPVSKVRCTECGQIYDMTEAACPSCGASRMSSAPL
jgi:hypothetical protein